MKDMTGETARCVIRQGYACEVVRALLKLLKSRGARQVRAGVEPGNEPSMAFLKKLGFEYLEMAEEERIFGLDLLNWHEKGAEI